MRRSVLRRVDEQRDDRDGPTPDQQRHGGDRLPRQLHARDCSGELAMPSSAAQPRAATLIVRNSFATRAPICVSVVDSVGRPGMVGSSLGEGDTGELHMLHLALGKAGRAGRGGYLALAGIIVMLVLTVLAGPASAADGRTTGTSAAVVTDRSDQAEASSSNSPSGARQQAQIGSPGAIVALAGVEVLLLGGFFLYSAHRRHRH
ncbi:hypothetical protein [Cumulibacter manganitolerans]|uniref:hypothetical protein n=1 Tax=Cumulibacter manganitolerans TaxID=1884992 RepID=UPI001297963F|nr:hypothetical protein [Cumulibacter manganitolerans]